MRLFRVAVAHRIPGHISTLRRGKGICHGNAVGVSKGALWLRKVMAIDGTIGNGSSGGGGVNGSAKLSDTFSFEGFLSQTGSSGTQQTGGWISTGNSVLEAVPAAVRVQLQTGGVVIQTGSAQQYAATLSLSQGQTPPVAQTLQLVPNMANSLNQAVSAVAPNVFSYTYTGRNNLVASVSSTGLVTPLERGGVCIMIGSPRAVNESFAGATPSGTEATYAEIQIMVVS